MDCFYQAGRMRQPAFFNPQTLMYGYGVPTYYSPQFFPVNCNSEISRPPVISRSASFLEEILPHPATISENNASPSSTSSQTPPRSPPSECSTERHGTSCSDPTEELSRSGKDASESEEKTGTNIEINLAKMQFFGFSNTCPLNNLKESFQLQFEQI